MASCRKARLVEPQDWPHQPKFMPTIHARRDAGAPAGRRDAVVAARGAHGECSISSPRRFRGFPLIVVDVETGGFQTSATDALLEMAAVMINVDAEGRVSRGETSTRN